MVDCLIMLVNHAHSMDHKGSFDSTGAELVGMGDPARPSFKSNHPSFSLILAGVSPVSPAVFQSTGDIPTQILGSFTSVLRKAQVHPSGPSFNWLCFKHIKDLKTIAARTGSCRSCETTNRI